MAGSICLFIIRGMINLFENACFHFLLSFMFSLVLSQSVAEWQNLLFVLQEQNQTHIIKESEQLDVLLRFCDPQLFLLGSCVDEQSLKFCVGIMDKA